MLNAILRFSLHYRLLTIAVAMTIKTAAPRTFCRAGWSQLNNLGLTELAAWDAEAFVAIAAGLAQDLPRLAELRVGLRARMEASPLMDAKAFARALEAAYRRMAARA